MIYYFTPYSIKKNLGKAYNQHMALLPNDDDWGVLMDGDIMFMTFDWGHQIEKAIEDNPDAGIISCYTNRISKRKAQLDEIDSSDILVHHIHAKQLDDKFRGTYKKISQMISGFLMIIKKKTWKDAGKFPEWENHILDLDGAISIRVRKLKKPIILMRGMYVFHYYRMAEGAAYKGHLMNAQAWLNRTKRTTKVVRNNKSSRNLKIIQARRTERSQEKPIRLRKRLSHFGK